MHAPVLPVIAASLLCLIAASCASVPQPRSPSQTAFELPPVYATEQGARGSLIDAIPLPTVSASQVATYMTPVAIGTRIKPDLLLKTDFFDAIEKLKTGFLLVRQIRILYWSEDPEGRPIQLSGLLLVPSLAAGTAKPLPLILLCHGTQLMRERVPSRLGGSERLVGIAAAASGMAVVLPDYPGLGDSEGFHPYCLADSLAKAGVDALRAGRQYLRDFSGKSVVDSGQVYVGGYSEGGYAAMAVLRELQTKEQGEFTLVAGYPMAVPADLSGTMRLLMAGKQPASSPYYLLYTLLGWQRFYPRTFVIGELLRPEVQSRVLPLMDGLHSSHEVNDAIAAVQGVTPEATVASRMLSDSALAALLDPGASPAGLRMLEALRANDLYDWQADPAVPLFLAASPTDEMVPIANSRLVAATLGARGASVTMTVLSPNTHADAGIEAYALMLLDIWKRSGLYSR
jgi:acetyl esterase/lipase